MCEPLRAEYQYNWCKPKNKPTFLSIPKTGSRVLMTFISAHVKELHEFPGRTDYSNCSQFAHPLPLGCMYSSNYKVVTMIRSPLLRTISEHTFHYKVFKKQNCSNLTWMSFLLSRDNYQLGYVVGKRRHVERNDLDTVMKLMENKKLIVGVFEQYTRSLQHIMHNLNLPSISDDTLQRTYLTNREFHPSDCKLSSPTLPSEYNKIDSEWYTFSEATLRRDYQTYEKSVVSQSKNVRLSTTLGV